MHFSPAVEEEKNLPYRSGYFPGIFGKSIAFLRGNAISAMMEFTATC